MITHQRVYNQDTLAKRVFMSTRAWHKSAETSGVHVSGAGGTFPAWISKTVADPWPSRCLPWGDSCCSVLPCGGVPRCHLSLAATKTPPSGKQSRVIVRAPSAAALVRRTTVGDSYRDPRTRH